jgi:hypothetical protein
MGMTKKGLLSVIVVATIAMWALLQSPLAQNSGKPAGAVAPIAPNEAGPGTAASEDAISADADRRAAAALPSTDSEPTAMPIIRGTGNPYTSSSKGGSATWGQTR